MVATWVHTHILEAASRERFRTEVTLNLQLRTIIFDVLVQSLHGFNGLIACIASNLKPLAFIVNVLVQVCQEDMLIVLLIVASVLHFDLAEHLFH